MFYAPTSMPATEGHCGSNAHFVLLRFPLFPFNCWACSNEVFSILVGSIDGGLVAVSDSSGHCFTIPFFFLPEGLHFFFPPPFIQMVSSPASGFARST